MDKIKLFIRLYYRQKVKFLIMVAIFALTGVTISCSLFIRDNNAKFYDAQLKALEESSLPEEDKEEIKSMREKAADGEESFVTDSIENILSVFAFISILIGIWGCTSLLFFQDISMQKSFAMLRVAGIQRKDLFYRALADGMFYGILGGMAGSIGGFFLFRYLSDKLCKIDTYFSLFSASTLEILILIIIMLFVIAFFGSLVSGLYLYEKPIVLVLYGRNAKKQKTFYGKTALVGIALIYVLVCVVFRKVVVYINILLIICTIVVLLLAGMFYLVFKGYASKRFKKEKALKSIYGISRCFLCTRNKRDAFLAATVSAGAIIICFVLNIEFNFSGILRDSYRDRQGYSTVVSLQGLGALGETEKILNDNGYKYTLLYSKWVEYSELNGVPVNEKEDKYSGFYAAVMSHQTDNNVNFQVQEGEFMAENYFVYRCSLELGEEYGIFGGNAVYSQNIKGSQTYMALVVYNVLVRQEDWHLGINDTWSPLFLLDLSKADEEGLKELLEGTQCRVETASQLTDELNKLMSDYISVILVAGFMLVLVTAAFFYSMVQSDLIARKKELYLYQMSGASRKKAFWVVYLEYLMIAWISSFSVVCVTMVIGSSFFRILLKRHYPLSVPVVLITSLVSSLFVLFCCFAAQWINSARTKTEIIRDE